MNGSLQDYRIAVLATPGIEEPELAGPVNVLKQAGASVDILGSNDAVRVFRRHPQGEAGPVQLPVDKDIGEASPELYDAVLVPGTVLDTGRIQLEDCAQDLVRSMRQAGKPIVCMPVMGVAAPAEAGTEQPPPVTTTGIWSLIKETVSRWSDINAPRLGAALAYYTLLSIAPLLVVAAGIAGIAFGRQAAQSQIVYQIRELAGGEGAKAIQAMLDVTQKPATGAIAAALGLLMLLFGASGVFGELRDSLNDLWGVKSSAEEGLRGMVLSRFFSFAMVLAIGFLLLVSLIISAAVAAAGKFVGQYLPVGETLLHAGTLLISLAVFTVLFALLYKVMPDARVEWKDVWIGAAVTSLLFSVGKFLIGVYLGKAAVGSAYGAAGSLVVFLVWVYYSAQIFFLGAEFTHIFSERHGSRAAQRCETILVEAPKAGG